MRMSIIIIFLLLIVNLSFSQSKPSDGNIKFERIQSGDGYIGEIMGFTDCENINDTTCVPIKGKNGVLLHNYNGNSGHIWIYEYDILNTKDFQMPENKRLLITDTSQIVMPDYPIVRDYCGSTYEDTDSLIYYSWEMRYDTLPPPAPGVENIGIVWDKKWTLFNDRSFMTPDTINIKKNISEVSYTFIYYDCLENKHEWIYTYYFENHKPVIY